METYKIEITSWTSSFRYPNIISGFQPTLEVPPISTVLGLINAASGFYQNYKDIKIGYYFEFEMKGKDLETIYMIQGKNGHTTNNAKSNVVTREFLFNTKLILYLNNNELVEKFYKPVYPIVLGRTNDLATINSIQKVDLIKIEHASKIKGQIIPFKQNYLHGQIQALPKYFTNTIPRNNLGTEPYSIISCYSSDFGTSICAYRDEKLSKNGIDIYFHELIFDKGDE